MHMWDHAYTERCTLNETVPFSLFWNKTLVRRISVSGRFGRLSLNSAHAKLAICTWRPLIFRRPICGTHGTLLGHNPSLGSSPISARGRDKKPPVWPSLRSFSFLLFPLLSLSALQTELNQQLHTPDAQSIGPATFCWGATSRGSRYREIEHHNGVRLLPAFSEPRPPSCVSSHTSLMPPPFFFSVTGAWEYLLSSCCCQQFWLKQREHAGHAKRCVIWWKSQHRCESRCRTGVNVTSLS